MKRLQRGFTAIEFMIVLIVLTVIPYLVNVYKTVVGFIGLSALTDVTSTLILRVLGIPFYPLGVVMGFF